MKSRALPGRRTLAAVLVAIGWASGAQAQQVAVQADPQIIEELVVTSRKRSENLQEIPDSVTVLGTTAIERAGIGNLWDFAAHTPNLSAYGNFRPNLTNLTIRGITSNQLGEPPVAFVVDGITVPNLEFMNQGLIDIERIEVIRGPQGALYGKNALGGAINIVTRAPSEATEVALRAAFGEGDDKQLNASVSGAPAAGVAYRLSAFLRKFDGLIKDEFHGGRADYVDEAGFQGLLGFDLTERTYLDFRARYSKGDYGVGWYELVADENAIGGKAGTLAHNVPPEDDNRLFNASAKLEHSTAAGNFIFVAGYNESKDDNFLDADFSALPPDYDNFFFPGGQYSLIEDKATTLEARFTSDSERRTRWLLGAYYQDRERLNDFDIYDDPIGTELRDRASFADELVFEIVRDRQESQAYALFGQLNQDLTDDLELTLALRYDEDRRKGEDPRDPASKAKESFSKVQPKASLAWQASDDLLAYVTLARGFRSGGFNEVAEGVTRSFGAEVSDTAEVGVKTSLADGALILNAAYFFTSEDNAQYTRFNPITFSLEQLAIRKVEVSGFEVEGAWRPAEALSVQFSLGFLDSEIKKFNAADFVEPPVGLIGNAMPRVADWNGSLTVTHSTPISAGLDLVVQASGNWLGERFFDQENLFRDKGATYLNLSLGLEADDWTLRLRGTNLLDKAEPGDAFFAAAGVVRFRDQPRQILGEVTYRF